MSANVPARSGNAIVFAVVNAVCSTPVIPVVPVTSILTFFVLSAESTKNVVVSDRDLFVNISVVAFPTRVSVASGRVQVLAAVIVFVNNPVNVFATFRSQIFVSLNVFAPVKVSTVALHIRVSVAPGRVITVFAARVPCTMLVLKALPLL